MHKLIPTPKQFSSWSLPSKLTAIGTFIALLSLGLYLAEKAFNTFHAKDNSQIEKPLVFSGKIDNNSNAIVLEPINFNGKIQFLNYYFPHIGPSSINNHIIDLNPIKKYLLEENAKRNPYGSFLFFSYEDKSGEEATKITIKDVDICSTNPEMALFPINNGIPLVIQCNYVLNGAMYTTVSLYHLYFYNIIPAVPVKYYNISDMFVCANDTNPRDIKFSEFFFIEHTDSMDMAKIEDYLLLREKKFWERGINDYAKPIK